MSSAVPTSISRIPKTTVAIDAATVNTLRAIAPQIDTLAQCWRQGTQSTPLLQASHHFMHARVVMDVQVAAAHAREALEKQFPHFKNAKLPDPALSNQAEDRPLREWARGLHTRLRALEDRIRNGYLVQEDPASLRDAVLTGTSTSALSVLSSVAASNTFSNFNVTDPRNARALGIHANLSELPLSKNQK
ncbi:MAG: hypothetical protein RL518_1753 [Pseudomonadota bacterium]